MKIEWKKIISKKNQRKIKLILSVIVLSIILGGAYRYVSTPYLNKYVVAKNIKYSKVFNDMNPTHLKVAKELGLKQPLQSRKDAEAVKNNLVRIKDNKLYSIDKLTHSIPYLTEGAAELLDMIGKNFLDSLESKGLNPNKIIVTSVLRTQDDIKRLQKSGNINASSNSAHCYATTFDITYARFDKIEKRLLRNYESVDPQLLKSILGEVLEELKKQGKCYVKYEYKQGCFHITSRM